MLGTGSPLKRRIMCNGCRNKYPLGPYYFPEYNPYVMEAEVERVCLESRADYVDPARQSAEGFEKYCAEKFKKGAAEHDDWLPDDASAQGILASVPAYDAQAAVRSALATWVSVVRERARVSATYNSKHAQARAEVLPILDQIVRDVDAIRVGRGRLPWHATPLRVTLARSCVCSTAWFWLSSNGRELYQSWLLV